MITNLLFRQDQNNFFTKQLSDNKEDIKVWNIINVMVPCLIIIFPTLLYSFLPSDRINFQNLILNGSFSLLGINLLFSTGVFLINSLRLKDVKIEKQIKEIRIRLLIYLCILLFIGSMLYVLQISFNIANTARIITIILGASFILVFSIGISKRIYLVKDELVGISYVEEIIETVNDLKKSTDDLD